VNVDYAIVGDSSAGATLTGANIMQAAAIIDAPFVLQPSVNLGGYTHTI
jgi:hypothetical protein